MALGWMCILFYTEEMGQSEFTALFVLPICGLTGENSVQELQAALCRVPGVSKVDVCLKTGSATISAMYGRIDAFAIVDAVRDAGYAVPIETVILKINGMKCVSCASRVESAMGDVAGVVDASVDIAKNLVKVQIVSGAVNRFVLEKAIIDTGYEIVSTAG